MARSPTNPLHTAAPRPQPKPRIYNRPWHLDADDRRHRGRRKWEPEAVQTILDLAGSIDWLYPPDFSRRDFIRLRASGSDKPLADLRTSRPDCLRLILPSRQKGPVVTLGGIAVLKRGKYVEMRFISRKQISSAAFARFFQSYVNHLRPRGGN